MLSVDFHYIHINIGIDMDKNVLHTHYIHIKTVLDMDIYHLVFLRRTLQCPHFIFNRVTLV